LEEVIWGGAFAENELQARIREEKRVTEMRPTLTRRPGTKASRNLPVGGRTHIGEGG